jgi:hypothetical protein
MTVWIVQCLCGPARHCILTAAQEAEQPHEAEAALRTALTNAIMQRTINPHCGLCGARVDGWVYEVGRSPHATLAEALPGLRASEAAQAATAARLKAQGLAYDAPGREQS